MNHQCFVYGGYALTGCIYQEAVWQDIKPKGPYATPHTKRLH